MKNRTRAGAVTGLAVMAGQLVLAGCTPSSGPAAGSGGASAAEIYQQRCQGCHGAQGQGGAGPRLAGLGSRADADIQAVIHDGKGRMPPFGQQLGEAQISALTQYVKGLK